MIEQSLTACTPSLSLPLRYAHEIPRGRGLHVREFGYVAIYMVQSRRSIVSLVSVERIWIERGGYWIFYSPVTADGGSLTVCFSLTSVFLEERGGYRDIHRFDDGEE